MFCYSTSKHPWEINKKYFFIPENLRPKPCRDIASLCGAMLRFVVNLERGARV